MSEPLAITASLVVPAEDISWVAVRASGPGGQNVNKVASKIALRFDLAGTSCLEAAVKARLALLAKGKLDAEGRILIVSQLTRDQSRNVEDARQKLAELIQTALVVPKRRRATKPSRGAKERRLGEKKRVGEKKRDRSPGKDD